MDVKDLSLEYTHTLKLKNNVAKAECKTEMDSHHALFIIQYEAISRLGLFNKE